MYKIVAVLSVFLSANAMKDEQEQIVAAVHKYLSTNISEEDKNTYKRQSYLRELESTILLKELQKAPWILLYNNSAQLDHNYQRFLVRIKEESSVLKVYDIAHDETVSQK